MDRDRIIEKLDREVSKLGVRIKDADSMKVMENVFDDQTLVALYKLVNKGRLSVIGGSISTGKEANVFYAEDSDGEPVAIKIYRIQSANFNTMNQYLVGDPRFSSVRKSKKEIIFAWTRKEYSNLNRAHDAGIRCPKARYFDRNILLMDFCGENEIPYPQFRQDGIERGEGQKHYDAIIHDIDRMYNDAWLVHADLSEFNILFDGSEHIIIDMGQAVTPDHPRAVKFLVRDILNINRFFARLCDIRDEEEIFREIIGEDKLQP